MKDRIFQIYSKIFNDKEILRVCWQSLVTTKKRLTEINATVEGNNLHRYLRYKYTFTTYVYWTFFSSLQSSFRNAHYDDVSRALTAVTVVKVNAVIDVTSNTILYSPYATATCLLGVHEFPFPCFRIKSAMCFSIIWHFWSLSLSSLPPYDTQLF